MSYKLIDANSIAFNSNGFITVENIEKMPCIYADLPNGMDGEHYILEQEPCEDAVSRQAVLEYIEGSEAELGHSSENELVCQYIKELPPVKSAKNVGQRIPVSEGMTNEELLDTFLAKYPGLKVENYRPLNPELYTKNLVGITIWLKNGDVIQYYPLEAQAESEG